MPKVRVAILGASGWMGRVHTWSYQNIPYIYGSARGEAEISWLVDADPSSLADMAKRVGGAHVSSDWRDVIVDETVDLVDICLPDSLHYEVAKAALESGKHVYCEKPLTDTAAEAAELSGIATKSGLITRVGHSFMRNPVHDLAKDIIDSGEIGDITMVKAAQHFDSFGEPEAPFIWRADGALAPTRVIGDTGAHVFAIIDRLVGRVDSLVADSRILTTHRPKVGRFAYGGKATLTGDEPMVEVTNPDAVNLLCKFDNGAMGVIEFSRTATGRKFAQTYEIYGTRGSITYNYDEINRLRFYSSADPVGRQGYRAIDVGPEQPNFAALLNLPNTGLGYNETKFVEASEVIHSVTTGTPMWPTFEAGHRISQMVEACMVSSEKKSWVIVSQI